MKLLKFQGYSDDTFACEGPGIDVDVDTCASGRKVTALLESREGCLTVTGQYAPGDCEGWEITYRIGDPLKTSFEWVVRIQPSDRDYSPLLLVEAPDDVQVSMS